MKSFSFAIFVIFAVFASAPVFAMEPWADQNLPVKDGLITWLDATRQEAAWTAHQKDLIVDDPMDVAYDGSGSGRNFVQPLQSAQPRYITAQNHAAIRFDGKSAHLLSSAGKLEWTDFTILLVASPHQRRRFPRPSRRRRSGKERLPKRFHG